MPKNNSGDLCVAPQPVLWSAFAAEAYGTFLFTSVILAVKKGISLSEQLPANALAISSALYVVCSMAGPISGAAINPAVGVIQTYYQSQHWEAHRGSTDKSFLGMSTMWVYVAGPLTGAIVSGILVHFSQDTLAELEKSAPQAV
jgi:glycerol uptake facilitator-like aquaporin